MNNTSPILAVRALDFQWAPRDPFLFCVHHHDNYPRGNGALGPDTSLAGRELGMDFTLRDGWRMYHGHHIPGFPEHPHRGFETVTIVRTGLVDHSDSLGAAGRYGGGDVQWLTTGSGVQHAEMFPLLNTDAENPLELFQIWLNLPAKSKMVAPCFKMLWREAIPKVTETDVQGNTTTLEIYAGNYGDAAALPPAPDSWAADADNHVAIWLLRMDPGAEFQLPAAVPGLYRELFFFDGDTADIAGQRIERMHSVELQSERGLNLKAGKSETWVLLLQGRPIDEPVAQYGPFVMNTQQEIQQAFSDYRRTRFGGWPWDQPDHTHGTTRGRFAQHTDGRVEEPGGL